MIVKCFDGKNTVADNRVTGHITAVTNDDDILKGIFVLFSVKSEAIAHTRTVEGASHSLFL
jgi:hypothetical protein